MTNPEQTTQTKNTNSAPTPEEATQIEQLKTLSQLAQAIFLYHKNLPPKNAYKLAQSFIDETNRHWNKLDYPKRIAEEINVAKTTVIHESGGNDIITESNLPVPQPNQPV